MKVSRRSTLTDVSFSAHERFDRGLTDVDRLMAIHAELGGSKRGQRVGLEPLNRSAIVLLVAVWEGFVEDIAAQALESLVDAAADPDHLPARLRATVAKEIKSDPHQLAGWKLAGDKWKTHLRARLSSYADVRARGLNTPDSQRVKTLFDETLGLEDVTTAWHWSHMSVKGAQAKLDELIKRRGDVAHGGEPSGPATVKKVEVNAYRSHLLHLVETTEKEVNNYLSASNAQEI